MASGARIDPLLEPYAIWGVELPNRVIMSPMARGASPNGAPSPEVATYYQRRVGGGVGTIFTESVFVDHPGTLGKFTLGPDDKPNVWPHMFGDAAIRGWGRVTQAVHAAGGRIFPQLMHLGLQNAPAKGQSWSDIHLSSPSGVWGPPEQIAALDPEAARALNRPDQAMSEADILSAISAFAEGAANAKAAGFDGIALHGGHGYLIDNFLRAETNVRTDKWGGDHVGRTRFAVELIRAVRDAVGEDLLISFRFSQWTHHDLDTRLAKTPKELSEILEPLAEAGVDIFEASARNFEDPAFDGSPRNLAWWTKALTGKAVAMVGGTGVRRGKYDSALKPPEVIDNIDDIMERFARDEFDLLQVGRSLLNDAHWLERARTGAPFLPFDPACLRQGYVT